MSVAELLNHPQYRSFQVSIDPFGIPPLRHLRLERGMCRSSPATPQSPHSSVSHTSRAMIELLPGGCLSHGVGFMV